MGENHLKISPKDIFSIKDNLSDRENDLIPVLAANSAPHNSRQYRSAVSNSSFDDR